ncbi:MAG: hypothetical protein ACQSGP_29680 [Frankia sp.]
MAAVASVLSAVPRIGNVVPGGERHRGPAGEELLPVIPGLASLFPEGGLRRGSTVTVTDSASLLLALLSGASRSGAWCAVVGVASLGVVAASEAGIALDRLALVATPGTAWQSVTAALLDAFEMVAVRPPAPASSADARRLAARARERGSLLVPLGPWEGADLRLSVTRQNWSGLGDGHGYLRGHQAQIHAEGRGSFARPRQVRMWLAGEEPADGSSGPAAGPPTAATPRPVVAVAREVVA